MTRYKMINGQTVKFTAEEETIRDAEEAQNVIDLKAKENLQTASANKKASGKAKLKELGLDDEEIKALTGA